MPLGWNQEESPGTPPVVKQGERATSKAVLDLGHPTLDLIQRRAAPGYVVIDQQALVSLDEGEKLVEESILGAAQLVRTHPDLQTVVGVKENEVATLGGPKGTLQPESPPLRSKPPYPDADTAQILEG